MRNERPEFDEGGRKRIKRRKLGLKDTGVQLVDYRDSWTAIEDEHVQMRQSDSEDRSDIDLEDEHVQMRQSDSEDRSDLLYDP
jgi:hypothetical protein